MYAVNQLPRREIATAPTGCCPEFVPSAWDNKRFQFRDKLFMKVSTHSFFHLPLDMNSVMKRAMEQIDKASAGSGNEYIMLSRDVSPWKSEHFISVSKAVPASETVRLSGTYAAKVFEGSFKDMGKWYKRLVDYAKAKREAPQDVYFSYTTCPRCARIYGKNYVVGFVKTGE